MAFITFCVGIAQHGDNLDNIRISKMERAKIFMDLSCIALLASRLSEADRNEKTKVD